MISKLLTTTLCLAAVAPAVAQTTSADEGPRLQGLMGEDLGPEEELDTSLGGQFSNPFDASTTLSIVEPGIYKLTLNDIGTGWKEEFLLGMPRNPNAIAPLLTVFHGYSRTPHSILHETKYFQKARRRGWFVIAPMGAHKYSFSIPYAQENIEAVLQWAIEHLPIDTDRIYGIGFSMGGGMVSTYAARHQDPNAPRFAAIVNHTGTVSMRDVYHNSVNHGILEHPDMFGGSPDEFPFLYSQSSALDIDVLGDVDFSTDFARNLIQTPVLNYYADSDPLAYLTVETETFHEHLGARKAPSTLRHDPISLHEWGSLKERLVFQFLTGRTLESPSTGTRVRVLADRDGSFQAFDVEQHTAGDFTSFDYRAMAGLNRLFLESVDNVKSIHFDATDLGLDPERNLQVIVKAGSSDAIMIQVTGLSQPPSDVLRGGSSHSNWTFDADSGVLELQEFDASRYQQWILVP